MGGSFVLGDEVVEGGEEELVGAVGAYDEGGDGAGDVLCGDVDGDGAGVGRGVAGGDDEAWRGWWGRACRRCRGRARCRGSICCRRRTW